MQQTLQCAGQNLRAGNPHAAYSRSTVMGVMSKVCGNDACLASIPSSELRAWLDTLGRALKRERSKSMMRHWSYDLNRHIALKRARDRVAEELACR